MSDGYRSSNVVKTLELLGFAVKHLTPYEIKEKILSGQIKKIKAYDNVHFIKAEKL